MNKNIAIGADIGGSHITTAAIDLVTGKILRETVAGRDVDNQASAASIISTWSEALLESISKTSPERVKGIGFAMPSPFDYVNGICYIKGVAKYENLYGVNIGEAISRSLGTGSDLLIRFMNDASSFAVGEAVNGRSKNVSRSLAITLGTGFGSAFVADKIPIVDGPLVPKLGCVFHLPYRDGIADDYFSTRGLVGRYKKATGKDVTGVKQLAQLFHTDSFVQELFIDFGINLGLFLVPWLKKFEAGMLVIGGNISNAYNLFGSHLEATLKEHDCSVESALSELKEDAALLGCTYLLDDGFWESVQHALPLM
jgi:glucokinase